nr:hypothetical protein [uncultured Blautia sp.]
MGRGSGGSSHGGGGHTGGHSFGGRSSGGSSRSGRSSGSEGYRSYHSRTPRYSGYYSRPCRRYYRGPVSGGGCFSSILAFIIVLIILFAAIRFNTQNDQNPKVSQSATQRTAITGTTSYKDWYQDDLNYIENDSDLTDGLKYFYSKTGIQPYVMMMDYNSAFWKNGAWDEEAADQYLADFYKNTFTDNGHMILAYFACENDSRDLDGTFYLYYGSAAYSVMDQEAERIFWSYFDTNYDNLDYSIAEFMGKSFTQTADNIMHIEKEHTTKEVIFIIFGAVIIIFIILTIIIRSILRRTKE